MRLDVSVHILHNTLMQKVEGLRPAATVIEKCGGIERTAQLVGRHRSVVNRWLLPKERGGTGGLVPAHHQPTLLAKAQQEGIKLNHRDFFDNASSEGEAEQTSEVDADAPHTGTHG